MTFTVWSSNCASTRIFSAGTGPDNNVKVPSLTTLTLAEAIPIAEGLGLRVQVVERVADQLLPHLFQAEACLGRSQDVTRLWRQMEQMQRGTPPLRSQYKRWDAAGTP